MSNPSPPFQTQYVITPTTSGDYICRVHVYLPRGRLIATEHNWLTSSIRDARLSVPGELLDESGGVEWWGDVTGLDSDLKVCSRYGCNRMAPWEGYICSKCMHEFETHQQTWRTYPSSREIDRLTVAFLKTEPEPPLKWQHPLFGFHAHHFRMDPTEQPVAMGCVIHVDKDVAVTLYNNPYHGRYIIIRPTDWK